MSLLLTKVTESIKKFFERDNWKSLLTGWMVFIGFFLLGIWFPPMKIIGLLSSWLVGCFIVLFLLIIGSLVYGFYTETERKIEAKEPIHKVTNFIFRGMKFIGDTTPKLAKFVGDLFTEVVGVILVIAVIGGVLGILVFGWKQLL